MYFHGLKPTDRDAEDFENWIWCDMSMFTLDSRSRGGLRKVVGAGGDEDEEEQSIDWERRRAVTGREWERRAVFFFFG